MKHLFALLIVSTFAIAHGGEKIPSSDLGQFIMERFDITSIPSSLGPRRKKGKTKFKDYGFKVIKATDFEVVLEEMVNNKPDWRFTISVLARKDGRKLFLS